MKENDSALYEKLEVRPPPTHTQAVQPEMDVVKTSFMKENDSALYETLEVHPPRTHTQAVQPEDQAGNGIYELDYF